MAKKILIADDEEMIRNAVKLSLENEGYEILETNDGREALEMATKFLPDLVILDIMMPGMNGYRVCQELKSKTITGKIIVLFLTARDTDKASHAVHDSGGDDLLGKPFTPSELRGKVKELLGD